MACWGGKCYSSADDERDQSLSALRVQTRGCAHEALTGTRDRVDAAARCKFKVLTVGQLGVGKTSLLFGDTGVLMYGGGDCVGGCGSPTRATRRACVECSGNKKQPATAMATAVCGTVALNVWDTVGELTAATPPIHYDCTVRNVTSRRATRRHGTLRKSPAERVLQGRPRCVAKRALGEQHCNLTTRCDWSAKQALSCVMMSPSLTRYSF